MSNIQELIDTVKEENFQNREISLNIDAVNQMTQIGWLEMIYDSLSDLRDGFYQYMADERDRFLKSQADLKAAQRADAERLKESKAKGFTTPAKTSSVAETLTQDGGLLGGLGIAGLAAALGAAVTGYFAGLTAALAKGLAAVTKMITPKAFTAPFTDFFRKFKFFVRALSDVFQGRQSTFAIKQFGTFSKTLADLGAKFQKAIQPIKNFFAPLGELAKLFPSGGGKFVEGIKAFGSKLGVIFKLFARIAYPIGVIIATVTGIINSFEEFQEDSSLLEKILITLKNVVKELVSVFITSLLELGKDIVSWVAGALGFTAIEEYLDSFDIDQKFREIFDEGISIIVEFFSKTKDALYRAARAIGIVDMDPEAEARIAAREVRSAEEDLAEADTRVQEAQAAVDAAPEGSRERARAETELNLATSQRNARAEDLQEAQVSAAERRTAAGLPPTPDTPAELPPTPDTPADQLQEVTVPPRDTRSETLPSARPTLVASNTSEKVVGGVVVERNGQPVPLTPEQEETVRFANEMATLASDNNQTYDVSANPVIESVSSEEPRVEPLSDLTNVTNINQASSAMQEAIERVVPTESNDLNALSTAGLMGSSLGSIVDGVKNLTSLPVGQASQEVAAAKDKPPVVAMGGSTTSIQNNVSSPNVHNYGSMSARSNDLSAQRLKDHMMA